VTVTLTCFSCSS